MKKIYGVIQFCSFDVGLDFGAYDTYEKAVEVVQKYKEDTIRDDLKELDGRIVADEEDRVRVEWGTDGSFTEVYVQEMEYHN